MMFYKPNGDRIEKDEFISIYSNYYYLDSPSDINVLTKRGFVVLSI